MHSAKQSLIFFNPVANILLRDVEPTAVAGSGRLRVLFTPLGCVRLVCFGSAASLVLGHHFWLWRLGRPPFVIICIASLEPPGPALTSEEIADQILSATGHRHRPQDPPSPRLQLLHGQADLVPLPHILVLNLHWHAELDPRTAPIPACTRCVTW